MTIFRQVTDAFYASPQIDPDDVARAKAMGIAMIVNNRPDREEAGQPDARAIEDAANAAGIDYVDIPVGPAGFGQAQIEALGAALARAKGPVLAFCRSGTRSTYLWSLARAKAGAEPQAIMASAAGAGYDLSPLRPTLDAIAAGARD